LLRLSDEIGSLTLNPGTDDADLYFCAEDFRRYGATCVPEVYLSFLKLVNGFTAGGTDIWAVKEIRKNITKYDPAPDCLRFDLGSCDHGIYYYSCPDDSYHLDLLNGRSLQFADCIDMLDHMSRIWENGYL
jgi:hypothetical protein